MILTALLLGSWASDGPGHVMCSFLSKGHKSEDFILSFLSEAGVHHAEWGIKQGVDCDDSLDKVKTAYNSSLYSVGKYGLQIPLYFFLSPRVMFLFLTSNALPQLLLPSQAPELLICR